MKKGKTSLEEQLAIKNAICNEFNLVEKKVGKAWLDAVDVDPDLDNPDHWDYLLYSSEFEVYINLKFFPRITIEPTHTNSYNVGTINYKKGMTPQSVLDYIHNILDDED